jgi:hypothetical protein
MAPAWPQHCPSIAPAWPQTGLRYRAARCAARAQAGGRRACRPGRIPQVAPPCAGGGAAAAGAGPPVRHGPVLRARGGGPSLQQPFYCLHLAPVCGFCVTSRPAAGGQAAFSPWFYPSLFYASLLPLLLYSILYVPPPPHVQVDLLQGRWVFFVSRDFTPYRQEDCEVRARSASSPAGGGLPVCVFAGPPRSPCLTSHPGIRAT